MLGEFLIFRHLRGHGLVPAMGAPPLRQRHIRIIRASWHVATVFGRAFGVILLGLASPGADQSLEAAVKSAAIFAFLGSALLVLIATKARHPGWLAFLAVAALVWLG